MDCDCAYIVVQLFKSYLRELPEAVITEVAYNEILMKIRSHSEEVICCVVFQLLFLQLSECF